VGNARVIRVAGPALPYDPTYHLLWRLDKVRSIVKREGPDVLEIDSPYAAAAGCLTIPRRYFGVRTFVWHSDFIDTYVRPPLEVRVGLSESGVSAVLAPLWSVARAIASSCDATFVAAKWIEEKLIRHGVQRVVRLPFGVDRAVFSAAKASDEVRRSLVMDHPEAALLVGVGRFAFEKRWDVVLDAVLAIAQERPCVLVLLGEGPERKALEARTRRMPLKVRFLGFETDRAKLASVLASADLLVHGCPFETFGFAVAEAMSSGLPAVVPDRGGAGELADASWAERYVAGDVASCARAIRIMLSRLANEGRPNLARNARAAAEKLPSVGAQFDATYQAYARLLARGGATPKGGLS
jgi:alpha-1,6-mannosyltransferase